MGEEVLTVRKQFFINALWFARRLRSDWYAMLKKEGIDPHGGNLMINRINNHIEEIENMIKGVS